MQGLEDGDIVAAFGQFARGGETAGAGADDCHFLAAGRGNLERLLVAVSARPVADIPFEVADGHRQAFVAADALNFALRFLRADAASDRGQGVIVEQALCGFRQVALGKQFDEARDIDAHRAASDALGVLAQKAAFGFEQGHFLGEAEVDLSKVGVADQRVLLRHLLAVDLETLLGGELGRRGHTFGPVGALER